MPNKNEVIVLVGPMGVGKTTIGKKLAKALNATFTDTDAIVVKRHGKIEDIFKNSGESTFRGFERDALLQAISKAGVVATGGGAILSAANQESLKSCTVVYLATDGKHIGSRLRGSKRPLIKDGMTDWQRIYDERKPIYEKIADITIDTSKCSLGGAVDLIKSEVVMIGE